MVGGEYSAKKWHCRGHRIEFPVWHLLGQVGIPARLDNIDRARFWRVSVIDSSRVLLAGTVFTIQAPVRGNQVHPSIPIDVSGGNPIPETRELVQGCRLRVGIGQLYCRVPLRESTVLIMEDANGPPFTGEG